MVVLWGGNSTSVLTFWRSLCGEDLEPNIAPAKKSHSTPPAPNILQINVYSGRHNLSQYSCLQDVIDTLQYLHDHLPEYRLTRSQAACDDRDLHLAPWVVRPYKTPQPFHQTNRTYQTPWILQQRSQLQAQQQAQPWPLCRSSLPTSHTSSTTSINSSSTEPSPNTSSELSRSPNSSLESSHTSPQSSTQPAKQPSSPSSNPTSSMPTTAGWPILGCGSLVAAARKS